MQITLEHIDADIKMLEEERTKALAQLNHTNGALSYARAIREGLMAPEPKQDTPPPAVVE